MRTLLLLGLLALPACYNKPQPTQGIEAGQLTGKCWSWDKIEREVAGNLLCGRTTINKSGRIWHCSRKRGHRGDCHAHIGEDCRWVFK
jgi:hypothetical protein